MAKCFVIQPFDKERFDRRYVDTFAPAIKDAGLEAYRVDQDPTVSIPIVEIEKGIRDADICFADITTDNPNVWFELGFAMASQKDVVMVCSDERESRFPFDVQHRSIIQYTTKSLSDYSKLGQAITSRLKALLAKEKKLSDIASNSPLIDTEGLSQQEVVGLATVMQNQFSDEDMVSAYRIKEDMNRVGYTDLAVTLSLKNLSRKGMVESVLDHDINGNPLASYRVIEKGADWLLQNQDKLVLKESNPKDKELPFPF